MEGKIALIRPYNILSHKFGILEPLELEYIASNIKGDFNFSVIDYNIHDNLFNLYDYDYVIIETTAYTLKQVINIIEKIRKGSNASIYLFGDMPTAYPMETLNLTGADCVIKGDPEVSINELVNSKNKGKKKYIMCRPVKNLNKLFFADRTIVSASKYRVNSVSLYNFNKIASIDLTRGCRHNCFDCIKLLNTKPYRYRSVENVSAEIAFLKHFKYDFFFFISDDISYNSKYIIELCKAIKPLNIQWGGIFKPILSSTIIDKMSESGCVYMAIPYSSGSRRQLIRMRENVNKRSLVYFIKACQKNNIILKAYLSFGTWNEGIKEAQETVKLVNELKDKNVEVQTNLFYIVPTSIAFKYVNDVNVWGKYMNNEYINISKLSYNKLQEYLAITRS